MLQPRDRSGRDPGLRWFHPNPEERYHELAGAEGTLASIRWAKERGTLATARWGERSWTFKRFGFFHPKITIRKGDSPATAARFEPNMSGGGTLHLTGGLDFKLIGNFWRGEWRWADPAGHDLVEFKRDFSVAEKNEGHISWMTSESIDEERMQLLIVFGWYVVIMLAEDAGEVAY